MNDSQSKKFEFFEVTADVGYKAYGNTLEEAFENAALAMFEVITDTSKIEHEIERKIEVESEDECALLYDWLSEFLVMLDVDFLIFSKFKVKIEKKEEGFSLKGTAWGEEFNPEIHESRAEVKAVTYHMMDVKQDDGNMVQVILDI
ncbi:MULTISPECIES: archease [Methanobacterium]|uniref:Protein archease n=1 Tax=Methanobacterium veterum TaxID=408577 RepID=A0A9E5A3Z9_9EURY|nr:MULTISPECIES: archease [Methanobacterium]MCZ3366643.1 archease [Methanobacterium veterum]MCZ3374212.1 archease [Methanobacterium veterum]